MTKIASLLAITVALSTPAFAGGYSDPVIEAPVVIEDTTASSSGNGAMVVLLSFVTIAGLAVSN